MTKGVLTSNIARVLSLEFEPKGFDVLYDHGQSGVDPIDSLGKLKSWFGTKYGAGVVLADLDIAIVARKTGKLVALIEIEETTSKPKAILGDALATLLGSNITFQGQRHLQIDKTTILMILAYAKNPSHQERLAFLTQQVNGLKANLSTPNAIIGQVLIDSFQNESELEQKLRHRVQSVIATTMR